MTHPFTGIDPITTPTAVSGYGQWTNGTSTDDFDERDAALANLNAEAAHNKCQWLAHRTPDWISGGTQPVGGSVTFEQLGAYDSMIWSKLYWKFTGGVTVSGMWLEVIGAGRLYVKSSSSIEIGSDTTVRDGSISTKNGAVFTQGGPQIENGQWGYRVPRKATGPSTTTTLTNPAQYSHIWAPTGLTGSTITWTFPAPVDSAGVTLPSFGLEIFKKVAPGVEIDLKDGPSGVVSGTKILNLAAMQIIFARWDGSNWYFFST